ncbi:Glycosyltransferase involved in cell wall bisynthesis [Candidatus Electrothrix aarhusensis]|uniref:Glycosyltransferase involved in cell wall bisynthesis n=1 Tax=Candidatus Electrothrix aarhusensis TaxID=1859131 RepID=A0A444IW11_9BACT|nr:Glycosyltransferase involved in cell wall bisynthesis [Candidatus Electrothrix aarhusensis]
MSGSTRSYEMARRLVAKGHDVTIITSWRKDDGRKGWFATKEAGINVYWLPVPYSNHMSYSKRINAFIKFALGASCKAASITADIVFATSTPLTIALPGVYTSWCKKIPMIFEVRDLWPAIPISMGALRNPLLRLAARRLEQFAYRHSAHIVALSPGMRTGVNNTGYPLDKITVIPNCSDLDLFNPINADASQFRLTHPELAEHPLIVYPGTIGIINGVKYLPRIAAEARKLKFDCQFVVVGDGKEKMLVQEEARKLGVLHGNFHIYSPVSKTEMANILAAADLMLSLFIDLDVMWANSANKFFDALASGTPVGINYQGWQADLLEEYGAGIILPANDAQASARLLSEFIGNSKRLRQTGLAARKLAEDKFNRDRLADELEQILTQHGCAQLH